MGAIQSMVSWIVSHPNAFKLREPRELLCKECMRTRATSCFYNGTVCNECRAEEKRNIRKQRKGRNGNLRNV